MASIRRVLSSSRPHGRMRKHQLSRRNIHDEEIHNSLKTIKKSTKDCIDLHRKWEKDKHFEVNAKYLAQANALLLTVDIFRQQLNLPWPEEMNEVKELKARNYQLSQEKRDVENHLEDAEYFLEEARIEIGRLKIRLGEQHEVEDIGTKMNQDNMPKHSDEEYLDDELNSDDEWNSSFIEGQLTPFEPSTSFDSRALNVFNDEAIQKEVDNLKNELVLLKEENNSLLDRLSRSMTSVNSARDEAEWNKQQMQKSDATVASLQQTISTMRSQSNTLQVSLQSETKRKIELEQSLIQSQATEINLKKTVDSLQNVMSSERQAREELLASFQRSQSRENSLIDTIERLQGTLSSITQTKAEALIRSKAIIELTDPNRPMKLAEKVSTLYDNEWTDAMENLENDCKIEEIDAIKLLLGIIKNVFTTFEDIGDAQTEFITSLELPIAVPDIDDVQETARPLLNTGMLTKLLAEITKALKDYRKISCETVSPLLFEVMKSRLQRVHNIDADVIEACDQFIQGTVSYVWMMRVQDPPVHIEWEYYHGDQFDRDRLRSYTKGGDSVDYVVWPILYLHKGGPMLAKGVAQGMKSKPK